MFLIYKATKYLRIKGALDFIELQMLRRVDFIWESITSLIGHTFKDMECPQFFCFADFRWADSVLSWAFATLWNTKHSSYESIRLFYNYVSLSKMFKTTDKRSKLLCINCSMIDWNSLFSNSRFIGKILFKINKHFRKFTPCNKNNSYYATIGNEWCAIIKF